MASITFTDTEGTVVLTNGLPAPGDRFQGWTPAPTPVAVTHHALGTQIPYSWVHARSYWAKFELQNIPSASEDDCQRLIDHLLSAGSVTITTDDVNTSIYTCYLAPGTTPTLSAPDPKSLFRTLSLTLINSEAARMTCMYQ